MISYSPQGLTKSELKIFIHIMNTGIASRCPRLLHICETVPGHWRHMHDHQGRRSLLLDPNNITPQANTTGTIKMCIKVATAVSSFSVPKNELSYTKTATLKSPDVEIDFSKSTTNVDKNFIIDHGIALQARPKESRC